MMPTVMAGSVVRLRDAKDPLNAAGDAANRSADRSADDAADWTGGAISGCCAFLRAAHDPLSLSRQRNVESGDQASYNDDL